MRRASQCDKMFEKERFRETSVELRMITQTTPGAQQYIAVGGALRLTFRNDKLTDSTVNLRLIISALVLLV